MKLIIHAIIAFLFFVSCIKTDTTEFDFNDIKVSPEYAFPVGQDTIVFDSYKGVGELELFDTMGINIDTLLDSLIQYLDNYYIIPDEISHDLAFPFSFEEYGNQIDFINSFQIRVNIITDIPGDSKTQVYFMQGADTLDKLFEPSLSIGGASVDDGNITPTDLITSEIVFENKAQIENLLNTNEILISTSLKLPSLDSIIVIYSNDLTTWVQVGARVSLNIEPQ